MEEQFQQLGKADDIHHVTVNLYDDEKREISRHMRAIQFCLFEMDRKQTVPDDIDKFVAVYGQMNAETLGRLLSNYQTKEANIASKEEKIRSRSMKTVDDGVSKGTPFYLWWGYAKFSLVVCFLTTIISCITAVSR